MFRMYLVRSVTPTPRPSEMRSAKVIELRARREARRLRLAPVSAPHRPDAA